MMTPAMLLMMLPWMTWFAVLNAPDSTSAMVLSLIPDRRAVPDAAAHRAARPARRCGRSRCRSCSWPPPSSLVVYAAGKIFRTGLLMQGKAATLGEMWRWVRA